MRYHVLATDYDGTIALHGKVPPGVIDSLKRLKASSRKLILVTGRELDELKTVFPDFSVFDCIVAENGALLYKPSTMEEKLLGEAPPASFIKELRDRGVQPLSVGRVIVATWEPHQNTVLEVIREAGIEHQVIFNKGAVMILPPGINKAKGLAAALEERNLSLHNVVAVGDAENDNAMLRASECAVAVANALQGVKNISDWVTEEDHGAGVGALIARLLGNDLEDLDEKLNRHHLEIGKRMDGAPFMVSPYGGGILLAGTSGSGKTTLTTAFLEALMEKQYQFCLVDPEGDYIAITGVVTLGDAEHAPVIEQLAEILQNPLQSVVVCTLAVPLEDRPAFFRGLLSVALALRENHGHPHWLILDEAHHLMPAEADPSLFNIPQDLNNFMLITTDPDLLSEAITDKITITIAIGENPESTLQKYAGRTGRPLPAIPAAMLQKGEALVWENKKDMPPFLMRNAIPRQVVKRHKRKYAAGDMEPDSFYFKGPEGKLNLKAQNLMTFIRLAEGVDDDTWMYHLKRKDYSAWFRDAVNDNELAGLAGEIEDKESNPEASRKAIKKLIEERYTGPAGK